MKQRLAWTVAVLAGVIGVGTGSGPLGAQRDTRAIAVAAASDLQMVLPDLIGPFEREFHATVTVTYGSSGNFVAQIQSGAPFDVFLSADVEYPRQLVASGHADSDTLFEYATGRLVLWTRKDSGVDVRHGLAILRDARVRRIAIANPAHAPYGRAAVAAIRNAGVYDAAQRKFVLGENISQAAQFVESGNADVGFVALSLALGPALRSSGVYFEVPPDAHPPIRQAAIVVSASRSKETAQAFLAYLRRRDVGERLQRFGFAAPR
jgi:molybdate transport system substrate-binding protein